MKILELDLQVKKEQEQNRDQTEEDLRQKDEELAILREKMESKDATIKSLDLQINDLGR